MSAQRQALHQLGTRVLAPSQQPDSVIPGRGPWFIRATNRHDLEQIAFAPCVSGSRFCDFLFLGARGAQQLGTNLTLDLLHDGGIIFEELGGISLALADLVALVAVPGAGLRSEEHTSELQSRPHLVCRL